MPPLFCVCGRDRVSGAAMLGCVITTHLSPLPPPSTALSSATPLLSAAPPPPTATRHPAAGAAAVEAVEAVTVGVTLLVVRAAANNRDARPFTVF